MNVARRRPPLPPTEPPRADALLASLEALAADETRRRRLQAHAVFAAALAHLVAALLLPRPDATSAAPAAAARELFRVLPTPRFVAPPAALVAPPTPRARRVPMPDPTPDEPEPLRALEPPAAELPLALDAELGALPAAPPPAEPAVVHLVGGEVLPPVKLFAPAPDYPEVARRARKEGAVVLRLRLDERGAIVAIEPLTRLGLGLEQAALAAVSKWRFEPATLRGRPVVVDVHLTVRFELAN